MPLLSTPALLLRSHPYGETSRILRFLTRDAGLIGVLAKGVRGMESKGGRPGLFAAGTLVIDHRPGKGLHFLRSFDPLPAPSLGGNLLRLGGASFLVEILLLHGEDGGSAELFPLLTDVLDRLARCEEGRIASHALTAGWMIVGHLGFAPELDRCVRCGREIGPDEPILFDRMEGGAACIRCVGEGDRPGPRIGPRSRRSIVEMMEGVIPAEPDRPDAHLRLLHDHLVWHLGTGRPFESFSFLLEQLREHS